MRRLFCIPRITSTLVMFVLAVVLTQPAQTQTFKVLYNFTGGQDGASPEAGLTMDKAGNLYGTTYFGTYHGNNDYGTVFKLTLKGSSWLYNNLYSFTGGSDGAYPEARVIFGPDGSFYGTTQNGGSGSGGTVFNLKPPLTPCKAAMCPWVETVIYSFSPGSGGYGPGLGDLVFDQTGNIYGTTTSGGTGNAGVVFRLTHSGGHWT